MSKRDSLSVGSRSEVGAPTSADHPGREGVSARRRFVRAASLGGLTLSTLSARSVLGNEQDSATGSAGSAVAQVINSTACEIPEGLAGREPGFWQHLPVSAVGREFCLQDEAAVIEKRQDIERAIGAASFNVASPLLQPDGRAIYTIGLAEALRGEEGPLASNLAAVWLNAYFGVGGFALSPPGIVPLAPAEHAQAWVTQFEGAVARAGGDESTVFARAFVVG